MLIHATRPLFAWSELADTPQLRTRKVVRTSLPDQALLAGLQAARGHGRNDYPVSVLWGVLLLSILCRYRCPVRHEGFPCVSEAKCNTGKKYGLSVRIKCGEDLRRFPPLPRAPVQFEKRYDGRTAVARVNARFKIFWGVDDGNLSGAPRFHADVGAVMVVHAALAKWLAKQPRWEGTLDQTRLGPAALALARLEAHMEEPAPAATGTNLQSSQPARTRPAPLTPRRAAPGPRARDASLSRRRRTPGTSCDSGRTTKLPRKCIPGDLPLSGWALVRPRTPRR